MSNIPAEAGPAVSLVIPAFNAAGTLGYTLESLRRQTRDDWEAIVIDDGSVDGTAQLIRDLMEKDRRVRGIFSSNAGVSAARNEGIDAVGADWLIFLDADDALPDDHLAALLDAVAEDPGLDVLHCGWRRYSTGGQLLGAYPAQDIGNPFAHCARACPFAIHAAMVRRERVLAVGAFDAAMRMCEDWDLWQRLARAGAVFKALPEHWVDVHMRAGSLSSDCLALCRAGLEVIERGHSSDTRVVSPHPDCAAGAAVADLPSARAFHLLWSIGNAIGRDDPLEPILGLAAPDVIEAVDPYRAVSTLVDGLLVGAGKRPEQWAQLPPETAAGIGRFVRWLDDEEISARGGRFKWHVERHVGGLLPDAADLIVCGLQVMTLDLEQLIRDFHPAAGIDRLHCRIVRADRLVGAFEILVHGPVAATQLAELVHENTCPEEVADPTHDEIVREPGGLSRLISWLGLGGRAGEAAPAPSPARLRIMPGKSLLEDRTTAILSEENARWRTAEEFSGSSGAAYVPPDYSSQDYWEDVFSTRNPWEYENSYETVKYYQTLDMVPPAKRRALEIACAEGHFTRMLAGRVQSVLATDISETAVSRAAEYCSSFNNIEFSRLDLAKDPIPGRFDLIICSEVLYYQPNVDALRAFSSKIADALEEGAHFILTHGNLIVDEPDRTGFPWPHAFGAKGIGDHVAEHPLLQLEQELWTPLYRVQRFVRSATAIDSPVVTIADAAPRLPVRVAEQVRWRGGNEVPVAEGWNNFPILLYHRIADEGPEPLAPYRVAPALFERQLALLRDNGWQGVSVNRLRRALYNGEPVPPRSVLFTFDDAYVDFLETALPLLHRYQFPAAVFVPVGKVGATADWDARLGEPAPILGWEDLALLRHCDVSLGSHGRTHRSLPALAPEQQLRELAGSRAELGAWLGGDVDSIAYPFGEHHAALARAARDSGYSIGMTCDYGWVAESCDPLRLPRVEIKGDLSIEGFAELLGLAPL